MCILFAYQMLKSDFPKDMSRKSLNYYDLRGPSGPLTLMYVGPADSQGPSARKIFGSLKNVVTEGGGSKDLFPRTTLLDVLINYKH